MKNLILISSLLFSLGVFAQERCTGSCWMDGCCEPQRPQVPIPSPSECRKSFAMEVCQKISVKEALSLSAAAEGVRVFISPDQQEALRCN